MFYFPLGLLENSQTDMSLRREILYYQDYFDVGN